MGGRDASRGDADDARRDEPATDTRPPGPGTQRKARRRRALKIVAAALAALVLASAATGAYVYEHLFGRIRTVSLAHLTHRPATAKADAQGNTAQNLLILGSQTRDGQSGPNLGDSSKLGTDISDTTMLVHVSAERKWAVVVSIPRDLIVPRPQCQGRTDPTVTVSASSAAMFDLAMNLGGPACAVATVEQMTGIRIDHFVEVTFNAFQELTTAVGGVTVCIPPPGINDPDYSGLVLGPGLHTVSGGQALEFVRDRHGVGTGTDLGRIQYQQMFVSSLFAKLTSAGTLSDPITLYKVANAVTGNLTVDDGLKSLSAMVGLAQSVAGLKSHYVQFVTAPYVFDPVDPNRVDPGQGFAAVWDDLRADTPLPGSPAAGAFGITASRSPSPSVSMSASASSVPLASLTVKVYNGTSTPSLAANAAANLKALGVSTSVGDSGYSGFAKTEIYYPAGQRAQAQALAGQVVGAEIEQSSNVGTLTLVVGQNAPANITATPTHATGPGTGTNASPSATISAESRTGDQDICSSLPTPVRYGGHP
ncbi:MAG TPA: LCP family protein [Actinocrinis sp.]|uniref:LCP family protein n=1 Tax=Actinocrinis sp. TaxID=1920516 RepID=UPI002DDD3918|nr:LCP family protein [Actinocrinis sp.]HEV2346671.1 LCP family protein [Actinocrinis sp.]